MPFGSVNTTASLMPGVMSLCRSLLTPAFCSRDTTSPGSLPGVICSDSRGAPASLPRSNTIDSRPDLVARITRFFSRAATLKPIMRVK